MAEKKVIYKEPGDYFTPKMKKIADDWEKERAAKQKQQKPAKKK